MESTLDLLKALEYDTSAHFLPTSEVNTAALAAAPILRTAREAGIAGVYFIRPSSDDKTNTFGIRPIVYVAAAQNLEQARCIHQMVWNIGYAPFLIITMPSQIRVYTGFDYQADDENVGLLEDVGFNQLGNIAQILNALGAPSIDSGEIWESTYAKALDPKKRVDTSLLLNLRELGSALKDEGLPDGIANALIGKYVYLSYLRDRKILSERWLNEHGISVDVVFSHNANVGSLSKLIRALDMRFNGQIFPLDFEADNTKKYLRDCHVSWVASVFAGSKICGAAAPKKITQLHLPFQAYNFQYIPVEVLSAIYEQFILERKEKGAIYTPEVLADYLISEVESVHPLKKDIKVFDPSCGSGVFLVLAYRKIIESEMRKNGGNKLSAEELTEIMLKSIFGVEREIDACYVTEFSLILTLLHYINLDPPDLQTLHFNFPKLHNIQIFVGDFFDTKNNKFWETKKEFDWIVGNPPWVKASAENQPAVLEWITDNDKIFPVGGKSVAEAFTWLVSTVLKEDGIIGLVMPATTLFNINSERFRKSFFTNFTTFRITNFANLREVLFSKATLPAATFVYGKNVDGTEKPNILHYGPFSVNQIQANETTPWVITINENEIQEILCPEAETGAGSLWKLALWGTYLDRRALEQLSGFFPVTLKAFCKANQLEIGECIQLREENYDSKYDCEYLQELKDKKVLNASLMTDSCLRYSIEHALEDIPQSKCYIRKRGGKAGLKLIRAPHIAISTGWENYISFSDKPFVLPRGNIGIAVKKGTVGKNDLLKALTLYMNSHMVSYYVFFHSQQWGVFRQVRMVTVNQVNLVPVPDFTEAQVKKLAGIHDSIAEYEKRFIARLDVQCQEDLFDIKIPTEQEIMLVHRDKILAFRQRIKRYLSAVIFRMFEIPADLRIIISEFVETKVLLDKPSAVGCLTTQVSKTMLRRYAEQLRDELDGFSLSEARHKVSIWNAKHLIGCKVELVYDKYDIVPIEIFDQEEPDLSIKLADKMKYQFSQWIYINRSIRIFDGPKAFFVKPRRVIDWTKTQAMIDAGDFIGEALVN